MSIVAKHCKRIELKQIIDKNDGVLSIAEQQENIPFEIRRVYYIYELEYSNSSRGFHAHKKLEQAIFCLNGSFKLMVDDGNHKENFSLNNPNNGIYMAPKLWHTMSEFSKDCIILVFASEYYDESDYIRDYDEFTNYIK